MISNITLQQDNAKFLISRNKIVKSNLLIIILLLAGTIFVYRNDFPLSNTIYYTFIFIIFIRSKDHILWTAFLLILLTNPWGLFYYKYYDWIIPISSTVSIPYTAFYGLIFFIKGKMLLREKRVIITDVIKPSYTVFMIYTVFLILISLFYGHSMASVYRLIVFLPSFLLFYSLPRFFDYKDLINLNKIIFLFVIVHAFGLFFDIIFNGLFIKTITFGKHTTGAAFQDDQIRLLGGIALNLYAMTIGLFYIFKKEKAFKNWYIWVVVMIAYIAILASATRGWMIASSFLFFASLLYGVFIRSIKFKSLLGLAILVTVVIVFLPKKVKENLDMAFNRLSTVESVIEGDLTAGGTLERLTERGPRTLTRFHESPIIGFGYSKVTSEYYDGHVGNHSLLIMGGIIGIAVVWLTVLYIAIFIFRIQLIRREDALHVISIALISFLIIHSSSRAMISFYFPADSAFLIALFFNHVNASLLNNNKIILLNDH